MILSHDVSKILTACRMLQNLDSSAPNESQDPQLSNDVYIGWGLKTSILVERNLDHLTLAGSGTHKFWSVATFDTIQQQFGEFRSLRIKVIFVVPTMYRPYLGFFLLWQKDDLLQCHLWKMCLLCSIVKIHLFVYRFFIVILLLFHWYFIHHSLIFYR